MTSETTCGRCSRALPTHIHQAEPGPYLCDGCLAEDADGQPWVGARDRVDGYAMIVAARRAKVEG